MQSDAIKLCLSRRFAMLEGRNQQAAMIATARIIREETKDRETYAALGEFITATPRDRQIIVDVAEQNLLDEWESDNA